MDLVCQVDFYVKAVQVISDVINVIMI